MAQLGFIGTGVMGSSMAGHLLEAGHQVMVFNRTKSKADDLITKGAVWAENPAEIAQKCDIIMTMLGYPSDVEEVYFGDNGLINNAQKGKVFIDFTTSTPTLAKKIHTAAKEKGIGSLDAPVSGGDVGAKNATLTIMCGGDQDVFNSCQVYFEAVGKNIILQGAAGSGQHTKMCNQIAIAAGMMGVCEAIRYAEKSGLDPERVLQSIAFGAAGSWSLSNYGPRILKGDFAPGFYVKHFIKDMKIALEEAEAMGIKVPGLALAKQLYEELAADGGDSFGTHALYKWYAM